MLTYIYTVSGKKYHSIFGSNFAEMLTDFQNSFANKLSSKCSAKQLYNISPNLKCVATLHCETMMSEKHKQRETCIIINDTSQRSVAT